MTLVPTEGVVGIITDLYQQSPEAAAELYRISLYEALAEQVDAVRPQMQETVLKNMAEVNAAARRTMLRSHVGKAINGEPEPDDLEYAEGLAILDEYIEKSLIGWALDAFNNRVNRDEHGRFTRNPSGMYSQRGIHDEHPQQQGAVDLLGLTLGASQKQGDRMTRNMFNADGTVKTRGQEFANDWYGESEGTNRQSYNRMRLTGEALTGASQRGSAAHTVGSIAQFAGNLGPEAEKILGPSIRRTAYRYRGTEREPDYNVTSMVDGANDILQGLTSDDPEVQAFAENQLESAFRLRRGEKPDPVALVVSQWAKDKSLSKDKLNLSVRGDAAVAGLLAVDGERHESVLPDLDLVRLSLESGEMPPSQGVIIDAEGNVTTQAVGYNGDHYLPFDLRNLGSLQGGQYVRSRATGGPTTEDIYTAMLTGARQLQVISHSGVFTVEFDPELRGGRRYGDKARRMVQRYGAMLEAIGNPNSNLFEPGGDLPPEEVSRIRQQASEASRTPDEFRRKYDDALKTARMKASFTDADMAEINEAAMNVGRTRAREAAEAADRSGSPMSAQRIREMEVEEARSFKAENQATVRKLKLDGIGYGQALKALKQEFPYYIRRADYTPLSTWMRDTGFSNEKLNYRQYAPSDMGYTPLGQTNTARARTKAREVPQKQNRAITQAAQAETERKASAEANGNGNGQVQEARGVNGEPKKVTLEDLARPDGPMMRELLNSVRPITNMAIRAEAPEMPYDKEATDDYIIGNFEPLDYLHWKTVKLRTLVGANNVSSAFTNWFLNEALPVHREVMEAGLQELIDERATNPKWDQEKIPNKDQLEQFRDNLLDTYDLLHPYVPVPAGTEAHAVQIDSSDPRPPKMKGVPEITASDEDFQYAQKNFELLDPETAALFKTYSELPDEERAALAEYHQHEWKEDPTQANQDKVIHHITAWSFVHTAELHGLAKPYLGTDAAPLEGMEKSDRPRRRLLFA